MRDFVKQLLEKASALTMINVTSTIAIYLAGYIIVNAFLSKNYILQTQVLHTSYISAGISFVFINLIAASLALPIAYTIAWLILSAEQRIRSSLGDWINRSLLAAGAILLVLLVLVLTIAITGLAGGRLTSAALSLSSRNNQPVLAKTLVDPLHQIYWRLIFVYVLLSLIIVLQNWLAKASSTLILITSLAILVFAFMEYYTILIYADKVYAYLPVTIGGGQPQHVRIYIEREKAEKYKQIFTEYGFSFFSSQNASDEMFVTNDMELFWQIGPSAASKEGSSGYAIHPISCDPCPVIFVPQSDIFSIGYFP